MRASPIPHPGGAIAVAVPVIQSVAVQQQHQQVPVQQQQQSFQPTPVEPEFVRGHSITEVYTNNNYVACSSGVGIQFGSTSSPGSVGAASNPSSSEMVNVAPQQPVPQQQQNASALSDSGIDVGSGGNRPAGLTNGGGVVITKIVEHPYSEYGSTSAIYTDTDDEWSRRASAVDPREIQMVAAKMMKTMPNLFTEVTKRLATAESQMNLPSINENSQKNNSAATPLPAVRNHHIDLDGSLPNLNNLETVAAATAVLAGSANKEPSNNFNNYNQMICSQPNINSNNPNITQHNSTTSNLISNTISATTPNIAGIGGDPTSKCDSKTQNPPYAVVNPLTPQHNVTSSCGSKPISASSPSIAPACASSSTPASSAACCNLNKSNKLQVGYGTFLFFTFYFYALDFKLHNYFLV